MKLLHRSIAATVAVVANGCLGSTPSTASDWIRPDWCGPRDDGYTSTRARSSHARIWERYGDVNGCLFSVGQSWSLTPDLRGLWPPHEEESVGELVLAGGRLVGYSYDHTIWDSCKVRVRVLDLRTGRLRRSLVAGSLNPPCAVYPTDIVLKGNASVAWIAADYYPDPPIYEVYRVDSRGRANLDNGAAIDPKSLRRRGSTITWTSGGVVRSATLK